MTDAAVYGWMAEFQDASALRDAVRQLRAAGYSHVEAYSPFPVDGVADTLQPPTFNPVAWLVLLGALMGFFGALLLQWYASVLAYPLNIAGRPLASWPAFLPAALEMTFLFAAIFGAVGMLVLARMLQLYHAAFNVERFAAASRDGFFVLVRRDDPQCANGGQSVHALLVQASALAVSEVAA